MVHCEDVAWGQTIVDSVPLPIELDDHAGGELQALSMAKMLQFMVVMTIVYQEIIEGLAQALLHRLSPPGSQKFESRKLLTTSFVLALTKTIPWSFMLMPFPG